MWGSPHWKKNTQKNKMQGKEQELLKARDNFPSKVYSESARTCKAASMGLRSAYHQPGHVWVERCFQKSKLLLDDPKERQNKETSESRKNQVSRASCCRVSFHGVPLLLLIATHHLYWTHRHRLILKCKCCGVTNNHTGQPKKAPIDFLCCKLIQTILVA